MGEERLQVLPGPVRISALQQQKREAVVGARERIVELERAPVVTDRFIEAARFGERDRHILQNAGIVGMIAQRQPVGRERGVIIPLTLEG